MGFYYIFIMSKLKEKKSFREALPKILAKDDSTHKLIPSVLGSGVVKVIHSDKKP